MTTPRRDLLKKLLLSTPDHGVVCASYLTKQGFTYDNIKNYIRSGYLDQLGRGAYCKHGNKPDVAAAVAALNQQLSLSVHIGGKTALAEHGLLHFVPFQPLPTMLFAQPRVVLPTWFSRFYANAFVLTRTNLLPDGEGVEQRSFGESSVQMAVPERAILELLHAVPEKQMLNEAYQILEMMTVIRPKLMQSLLQKCSSVKVMRLFFLLAERAGHSWFGDLDQSKIDLGSGCRVIEDGGTFNSKWQVVVKDWSEV